MPLHNPNPFFKKMRQKDPELFLVKKEGKFNAYSKVCASNLNKQPVILTDAELAKIDKEHPGSYSHSIKYGSDPNNQFNYICPRFWCLKTNTSMTEKEVKTGICGKIIPQNASVVPKDAFVFEFTDSKEHIDTNGNYIQHHPGFAKSNTSKGFCQPCCYKQWNSKKQEIKRAQCQKNDKQETTIQDKQKSVQSKKHSQKTNLYIISIDTFPIQTSRWGFLPFSVQLFLNTNNDECISRNNPALIRTDTPCLLRYGVEQVVNQSFLGCIADLYSYSQKLGNRISVEELKKSFINSVDLDRFIQCQKWFSNFYF